MNTGSVPKRPASVAASMVVSVDQMREVDRLMTEEAGISLIQMMENAGRALATHARGMLGGALQGRRITVLAGSGGNGGGGLVAARRLSIWGARVSVVLAQSREQMGAVPRQQLAALEWMSMPIFPPEGASPELFAEAELLIDALLGYSLRGAPREPIASLIRMTNRSGRPALALDLPSGLGGDSGIPSDPTIRAAETLTLALPKRGMLTPVARPWVGQLYLADISVPAAVYRRLGLEVGPIFAESDVIPIATHG